MRPEHYRRSYFPRVYVFHGLDRIRQGSVERELLGLLDRHLNPPVYGRESMFIGHLPFDDLLAKQRHRIACHRCFLLPGIHVAIVIAKRVTEEAKCDRLYERRPFPCPGPCGSTADGLKDGYWIV